MSSLPNIGQVAQAKELEAFRNRASVSLRSRFPKKTAKDVGVSFFHIPDYDFTEEAAQELIDSLVRRIEQSSFSHRDCGVEALEYLRDAGTVLRNAADEMEAAWDRQQQRIDEGDYL